MSEAGGRTQLPQKTREMRVAQMDSTIWNDFRFRPGDIIIATYAKAGTTWTQQIVAELVMGGADLDVHAHSPWVESRTMPFPVRLEQLEAQTHRRFLKSHLPLDVLGCRPEARYIYIARDGRDVVWSMHNHHMQLKPETYDIFNRDLPPGAKPFPKFSAEDRDMAVYFRRWMERNGEPWWPFWENVRSWWAVRRAPNVLVLHFAELKRNLAGEIKRIAAFLEVPLDDAALARAVTRCSFEYMKANAQRFAPRGGGTMRDGASAFFRAGTNGRWRDVLTPADIERYEELAEAELGSECARWLAQGGPVA